MLKQTTFVCTLMVLLTFLSCSETSNPTPPDDSGNNNNSNVKRIIYMTVKGEFDTNRVVWVSDINGGNKREIMSGNIRFNSRVFNEKAFIVKEGYNAEHKMRYSSLYLVDLRTGNQKLVDNVFYDRTKHTTRIRSEAAITSDGNKVCFVIDSASYYPQNGMYHKKSRLYVLDLRTKEKKQLADDVAAEQQLRISNDSKHIAYYGGWYDNESPTDILYVAALDGTLKKRIICEGRYRYDGATTLEWSQSNNFLITMSEDNKIVFINTLLWQAEKTVGFEEFEWLLNPVLSPDDKSVYFSATKGRFNTPDFSCEMYSYSIDDKKLSQITDSTTVGYKFSPKISKDGSTLLFSSSPIFDDDAEFYYFRTLYTMNLKDSSITALPDKSTYIYNWVE